MRTNASISEAGFTLVEVLAALLIFSFAIIGLTHSGTESVRAITILEHKTYAGIVADNRIVQARLKPLKIGVSTGEETAAGRNYEWREEISETESRGFYRILCLLYTSPSPRDKRQSRMPSSA